MAFLWAKMYNKKMENLGYVHGVNRLGYTERLEKINVTESRILFLLK